MLIFFILELVKAGQQDRAVFTVRGCDSIDVFLIQESQQIFFRELREIWLKGNHRRESISQAGFFEN